MSKNRKNLNKRNSHQGKSTQERRYYTKAIRDISEDPTIDESLPFEASDDLNQDFSLSTEAGKRPLPVSLKMKEHFAEHWFFYIPGAVFSFILPWFFSNIFENRERIVKTETRLIFNSGEINEQQEDLKSYNKLLNNQFLLIKELQIKLDKIKK